MTTCSYCGGAGGAEENLEHNTRCPRFGDEVNVAGLNALRDGTRNPVAMVPCETCATPMPARPGRAQICAACLWITEDRRIRGER